MRIGDAYVTGSSIMPQKRTPDFAEAPKAKAALAGSTAATLLDLTRGDASGYNREQQWSKYLMLDLFAELGPAPVVLRGAIESLTLDKKRMRTLMQHDFLEAADVADYWRKRVGWRFGRLSLAWRGGSPERRNPSDLARRSMSFWPRKRGFLRWMKRK
jgi:argininosuccinate lyase